MNKWWVWMANKREAGLHDTPRAAKPCARLVTTSCDMHHSGGFFGDWCKELPGSFTPQHPPHIYHTPHNTDMHRAGAA